MSLLVENGHLARRRVGDGEETAKDFSISSSMNSYRDSSCDVFPATWIKTLFFPREEYQFLERSGMGDGEQTGKWHKIAPYQQSTNIREQGCLSILIQCFIESMHSYPIFDIDSVSVDFSNYSKVRSALARCRMGDDEETAKIGVAPCL